MSVPNFRDLPIKWKFTLITTLTSSLTLLLAAATYLTYDIITFRQAMTADLSTLAKILSDNSAAAFAFDDQHSAAEFLKSLAAEPHIISACAFHKDGRLFAKYERGGAARGPSPRVSSRGLPGLPGSALGRQPARHL